MEEKVLRQTKGTGTFNAWREELKLGRLGNHGNARGWSGVSQEAGDLRQRERNGGGTGSKGGNAREMKRRKHKKKRQESNGS